MVGNLITSLKMNILKLLLRVFGRVSFILPLLLLVTQPISELEVAAKELYVNLNEYFTAHGLKILNNIEEV